MASVTKIERQPAAHALASQLLKVDSIFVEGDSDVKYWKNIFLPNTHITACNGWPNVLDAVRNANRKATKCIGIIDCDFKGITHDCKDYPENIFISDDHDLEMMMYKTDAYSKIVRNSNIHIEERTIQKIRDNIINIICRIGYLKIACEKSRLEIKFKRFKKKNGGYTNWFHFPEYELAFVKDKNFNLDQVIKIEDNQLLQVIVNFNSAHNSQEAIQHAYEEELKNKYDEWQLGNGHDFTYILMYLLNHYASTNTDMDTLEEKLYLAYNEKIHETNLYKSILDYCTSHEIKVCKT